jgi:xyloglucan O-acetyltransferase
MKFLIVIQGGNICIKVGNSLDAICIYCSEDNITSFDVTSAVQMALRSALNNLNNCQECGLQLTLVRTATPALFENGFWNTGGYCNRTEPLGEEQ